MKYNCPQCDNVYYEKKELSEHIEEVHVKQEKGNLLNFKVYFHSYCMTGKKTYR